MTKDTETPPSRATRQAAEDTTLNRQGSSGRGFLGRFMDAVRNPLTRRKNRKKKGNPNIYPLY